MYVVPIVLRPVIRGVCIVTIVDLCSTNSIRISIEDDSDDGRYREYFTFSTNTVLALLCSFPCGLTTIFDMLYRIDFYRVFQINVKLFSLTNSIHLLVFLFLNIIYSLFLWLCTCIYHFAFLKRMFITRLN